MQLDSDYLEAFTIMPITAKVLLSSCISVNITESNAKMNLNNFRERLSMINVDINDYSPSLVR